MLNAFYLRLLYAMVNILNVNNGFRFLILILPDTGAIQSLCCRLFPFGEDFFRFSVEMEQNEENK